MALFFIDLHRRAGWPPDRCTGKAVGENDERARRDRTPTGNTRWGCRQASAGNHSRATAFPAWSRSSTVRNHSRVSGHYCGSTSANRSGKPFPRTSLGTSAGAVEGGNARPPLCTSAGTLAVKHGCKSFIHITRADRGSSVEKDKRGKAFPQSSTEHNNL